jgi:hypothetical protein
LDYCVPNFSFLEKTLSFNVENLETLSDADLSKFVIVLGQYLVFLKYKHNECMVSKIEIDKRFEYEVFKKIQQNTWKTGTTIKEKTRSVSESCQEIKEIEYKKDIIDSKVAIISGMYEAFSEYLNTYKKEQGRRLFGKGYVNE